MLSNLYGTYQVGESYSRFMYTFEHFKHQQSCPPSFHLTIVLITFKYTVQYKEFFKKLEDINLFHTRTHKSRKAKIFSQHNYL